MHTLLTATLALLAAFLGYRYGSLLRGLRELNTLIRESPEPKPSDLKHGGESSTLADLSRAVLNHSAEADLARDLEASRRRFLEALLDEIDDALFIINEQSEIRFANRAARTLFPSEHDPIGRPLIAVCLDHRIIDTVRLARELDAKTEGRFNRRSSPGDERPERIHLIEAEPLASQDLGRGAWVLIRDITLTLETERVRQDFVANASHELRTPLSIISGYLEMLDVGDRDDENDGPVADAATLRRCVPTMRLHAGRLSRIIDDMLAISKLEGHEEFLTRERFDLGECIRESVDRLQPLVAKHRARVSLDLPDEAVVDGDRFYWDQIFFNLIENALKQNPEPGLRVRVRLVSEQDGHRIEISDNGVGIPADDLPHVFKRFYRVQKDHSQHSVKGTGLGLSIVKRAIEAHHGTIRVESHPGRRTAFLIEIPQPPAVELADQPESTS